MNIKCIKERWESLSFLLTYPLRKHPVPFLSSLLAQLRHTEGFSTHLGFLFVWRLFHQAEAYHSTMQRSFLSSDCILPDGGVSEGCICSPLLHSSNINVFLFSDPPLPTLTQFYISRLMSHDHFFFFKRFSLFWGRLVGEQAERKGERDSQASSI